MADEMIVKELDQVVVRFSGDSGDGRLNHNPYLYFYNLCWSYTEDNMDSMHYDQPK